MILGNLKHCSNPPFLEQMQEIFLNTVLCDAVNSCVIILIFKRKVKWEERVKRTIKSYFLLCFIYMQGSLEEESTDNISVVTVVCLTLVYYS